MDIKACLAHKARIMASLLLNLQNTTLTFGGRPVLEGTEPILQELTDLVRPLLAPSELGLFAAFRLRQANNRHNLVSHRLG